MQKKEEHRKEEKMKYLQVSVTRNDTGASFSLDLEFDDDGRFVSSNGDGSFTVYNLFGGTFSMILFNTFPSSFNFHDSMTYALLGPFSLTIYTFTFISGIPTQQSYDLNVSISVEGPQNMPFCFGPLTYVRCVPDLSSEQYEERLISDLRPGDLVQTKKGPREVILVKKGRNVKKMFVYAEGKPELRITDTHAVAMTGQDLIFDLFDEELPKSGTRQDIDVILARDDPRAKPLEIPDSFVYHVMLKDDDPMVLLCANGIWAESLGTV